MTAPGDGAGESVLAQLEHERVDLPLAVVDHRLAVGRLVARGPQRVRAQRVAVGGGLGLLDEASEDPGMLGGDVHTRDRR